METQLNEQSLNEIAEVELIYKTKIKASERVKLNTSKDAADLLRKTWDEKKIDFVEQCKVLLLIRLNKVLGIFVASRGGVTGTVVDPKIIFVASLKANACNIIISHNHLSGNLQPSGADQEITRKIKLGGEFLDIKLFDHIIVSSEGYYSLADEGLL